MPLLRVDPADPAPDLSGPAAALRAGELVAFPTETVYGLGANALDPAAVARIFEAKGRPATNPLIVHVASVDQAATVAEWSELAQHLADAFWPGPLTLVLPKRPVVPDIVSAGLPTVGVRMPAHPVALALITQADRPLAAPSANPYTAISPTRAEHVVAAFGEGLQVVDGGPTAVGLESTVLSLVGPPRILRPGAITAEDLAPFLPELQPLVPGQVVQDRPAPAPGLARRHYAPRARLVVGDPQPVDGRAGWIRRGPGRAFDGFLRELPRDPAGFARELYAALHACDRAGCDVIFVQPVPEGSAWEAVRDRLERAAAAATLPVRRAP